jgi:hypothetical protein
MRTPAAVIAWIPILTTCTVFAQGLAAAPTRVARIGSYTCLNHPQIQATWPARCPLCGTALQAVQPLNAAAGTMLVADANYADQDEGNQAQSQWQNQPYGSQPYYSSPQPPQYGNQGYPPYPPSNQYGNQGYPPIPNYGYGQGGYSYPPANPYGQAEPNDRYSGILEELNRLFNRQRQQSSQGPQ